MADRIRINEVKTRGDTTCLVVEGEEPMTITAEAARRRNLHAGVILTPSQFAQLQQEARRYACEQTAARMLAGREHSEWELTAKLRRKGFDSDTVMETVRRYRQMGAVDDARYAQMIGRSLVERKPCGKAYVSAYLQKRGITRELAEAAAETLLGGRDETDRAAAALEQRRQTWAEFELETARRKAYNYLARRGFGFAAARSAFEQVFGSTQ